MCEIKEDKGGEGKGKGKLTPNVKTALSPN